MRKDESENSCLYFVWINCYGILKKTTNKYTPCNRLNFEPFSFSCDVFSELTTVFFKGKYGKCECTIKIFIVKIYITMSHEYIYLK